MIRKGLLLVVSIGAAIVALGAAVEYELGQDSGASRPQTPEWRHDQW